MKKCMLLALMGLFVITQASFAQNLNSQDNLCTQLQGHWSGQGVSKFFAPDPIIVGGGPTTMDINTVTDKDPAQGLYYINGRLETTIMSYKTIYGFTQNSGSTCQLIDNGTQASIKIYGYNENTRETEVIEGTCTSNNCQLAGYLSAYPQKGTQYQEMTLSK